MTTETLKALALYAALEGGDYFTLEDLAYVGKEEDAHTEWQAATEDENEDQPTFEEWCEKNLEVIDLDYYENLIKDGDYNVFTNDEANEEWEERLQNYLDECVIPEIPESYRRYFDEEKWMDDARYDGRGHAISSYDGNETEITVEDETFYIYRQN